MSKKNYTQATVDFTRPTSTVEKLMLRAQEIQKFIDDKNLLINSEKPYMVEFFAKCGVKEIKMVNFYSTHHGDEEYTSVAKMKGHIYFIFHEGKEPKNLELWAKKVTDKYNNEFLRTHIVVKTFKGKFHGWSSDEKFIQAEVWF